MRTLQYFLDQTLNSFWKYIGVTIWFLIITGYMQNKIFPGIAKRWKDFKNIWKQNFEKNKKGAN